MISLFLFTLLGALARRLAGGVVAVPGGTLVARSLAAGGLGLGSAALLQWFGHPVPWMVLAWVPPLFFLGMASGFPTGGMVPRDAGHVGGLSQQHGWALIGPLALWAAHFDMTWWPLVLAAALVGPIYWAATLWQPTLPALGFNKRKQPDPPAWAEPWIGAAIGAGLWAALT